jgi:heptaprenyl diphosphate synthase
MTMADLLASLAIGPLSADMARVESRLRDAVQSEFVFLSEVTTYLSRAGGKRVRPMLALMCSYIGSTAERPADDGAIAGAVAAELLHIGSLYHDDVMDEADTRRGVESANSRWRNVTAVLAGDILFARACNIACQLGQHEADMVSWTLDALCTGQALEVCQLYDVDRSEASYLDAIAGKTAALTAAAAGLGARGGGLDETAIDVCVRFGHHFGMAFQLVDDVLDLTATEEQLGKPTGNDLREGVYTLPVLLTLRDDERLRPLLGGPMDDEAIRSACELVRDGAGVEQVLAMAKTHMITALAVVAELDPHPTVSHALQHLASFVLDPVVPSRPPHAPGSSRLVGEGRHGVSK